MTLRYSHAPRPTAAPVTFKLDASSLTIDSGRKIDIVQLGAVERVRLTYKPRSFAPSTYRARLTLKGGKTVSVASLSWRSLVEAENRRDEYRLFVTALTRAVRQANPKADFVTGRSRPVWIAAAILGLGSLAAITVLVWRALQAGSHAAALLVAFIGIVGIWQLEPMIRLNQPGRFNPDEPPGALMP